MARLKEENIPWDALAKLGITKDYLVQSNNLDNLLNYQKTSFNCSNRWVCIFPKNVE